MLKQIDAAVLPAETWKVIDRNAREKPRVHEPAPGHIYALSFDKATEMPRQHAVVFLRDPAFRVFDEAGAEQTGLPGAERGDALNKRPALEPDETIARFDELTTTALLARAVLRPGGHEIPPKDRKALVAFLHQAPVKAEAAEGSGRSVERPDPDAINDKGLDAMLGPRSDPLAMG